MDMFFLFFFFPIFLTSEALFFSFNSSILLAYSAPNTASLSPPVTSSSLSKSFLKEVLNAVATKEQWDPDSDARVSVTETESTRVTSIESFEFYVRVGRVPLILKFSEESEAWRKAEKGEVEFGPDFVSLHGWYRQGIRMLKLEGPLELHASGVEDVLSVHLPAGNLTHHGLKRVLVGEGISIEVDSSDEISLFFPYGTAFVFEESTGKPKHSGDQFWPLGLSSCAPMVTVRVAGPASVVAFGAYIKTSFPFHNTMELLPEKCYSNGPYQRAWHATSQAFLSKFRVVEMVASSFLGKNMFLNRPSRLLQTKITPSTLVKFRAEVVRNITENDRKWKKVARWRTRPSVDRSWFEIVGRIEGERGLVPLIVRRLSRPLMIVESAAWSHLMSNMSFTEFPSIVVPPEALTLDVKW